MQGLVAGLMIEGDGRACTTSQGPRVLSNLYLLQLVTVVFVVVVVVHLPVLSAGALSFDDQHYLIRNSLVQNPGWASARRFLSEVFRPSTVPGYYQPLTMISLMLDYALGGRPTDLYVFHRTSLILHGANAALMVVLLYLLFGHVWMAAAVGLLFGMHPITVESVAWIAERKTVLTTLFSLLCIILYVCSVQRRDARFRVGCCMAFALALLSKPTSTPLPLLLCLLDYWPLGRTGKRVLLEKVTLFAMAGLSGLLTYASQANTAGVELPGQYGVHTIPPVLCHNLAFYLRNIFWPTNVPSYCGLPACLTLSNPMVRAGSISLAGIVLVSFVSLRWTRAILASCLAFLLMILPAMQIIGVSHCIAAVKYAYLPAVGFCLLLMSFLCWVQDALDGIKPHASYAVIGTGVMVLAMAEVVLTRPLQAVWHDSVGLHRHMLRFAPESDKVHNNMGLALSAAGQDEEAVRHYRKAIEIDPNNAFAQRNLAVLLVKTNRIDEAIEHFRMAVRSAPYYARAYNGLGYLLKSQGKLKEAIDTLQKAIKFSPSYGLLHYNLGSALVVDGKPQEGIRHLREAVRLDPYFPFALKELAWVLATHTDPDVRAPEESLEWAQRLAKVMRRRDAAALDVLAAAYAANGQFGQAIDAAETALKLAVDSEKADLAEQVRKRLDTYRLNMPHLEDPVDQWRASVMKRVSMESPSSDGGSTGEDGFEQ